MAVGVESLFIAEVSGLYHFVQLYNSQLNERENKLIRYWTECWCNHWRHTSIIVASVAPLDLLLLLLWG